MRREIFMEKGSMPILKPVLGTANTSRSPTMEAAVFPSGSDHKLYLVEALKCPYNGIDNGGGNYTTDWVTGKTSGLGDCWTIDNTTSGGTLTYSILTGGNGFTDRHQYFSVTLDPEGNKGSYCLLLTTTLLTPVVMGSRTYRISFKYRSNTAVGVWIRKSDTTWPNDVYWGAAPTNTGDATTITFDVTVVNSVGSYITALYMGHSQTSGYFTFWLDVDEINMCDNT
jgi:hypothetical protein